MHNLFSCKKEKIFKKIASAFKMRGRLINHKKLYRFKKISCNTDLLFRYKVIFATKNECREATSHKLGNITTSSDSWLKTSASFQQ